VIPVPKLALRQRLSLMAIRGGLASLDVVSTRAAARAAGQLFLRPPPSPFTRNLAGLGQRFELSTSEGRAVAWQYGSGPATYLLHGWGGRGFQLSGFVAPLVARGRTVVLLDAPGHGEAGGGTSSVLAFAHALRAATERFGPASGVIAHSLGAMSVIISIAEGLEIGRAAFLAPGSSLEAASQRFQKIVGVRDATMQVLKKQLESRFQKAWDHYDLARLQLKVPLWVVHDQQDAEVPLSETHDLVRQWSGAQLEITNGLGHYRVLRNADVIAKAVAFLGAPRLAPKAT
jgi:pimeloyl-ACP methyl ester carboxylesterase